MGGGRGMMGGNGMAGGGANSEFTAQRDKSGTPPPGIAGKWLVKDGENQIQIEFKVDGAKLAGKLDNSQMPGAIDFKDGKIDGDKISFEYVRQSNGQDIKVQWTGVVSGDEIKFKRQLGN
jgi:hypothetical protein